jgi:O-antigen ligase
MNTLTAGGALIVLACATGLAARLPAAAAAFWMLVIEATPEFWLSPDPAIHEDILGLMKAAGLALALILAIRHGAKPDRYNPAAAFVFMFAAGLAHGLYPNLTFTGSFRSLLGSIAPFAFGFVKLPKDFCRAIIRTTILGPLFAVAAGCLLQLAGLHTLYDTASGTLRLTAGGEAPFLGGFALIAIYAGLLEFSGTAEPRNFWLIAFNFLILILTGARAPLALAAVIAAAAVLIPNPNFSARGKLSVLAAAAALASLALIFSNALGFVRIIGLAQSGDAANLSHRELIWPYFQAAIHSSPWFGWGLGAGKVIIPVTSALSLQLGTNAAHNEYLRIGAEGGVAGLALLAALMAAWAWRGSKNLPSPQLWLMRLIFIAFAIHSWTDNTLIATTSSILFIWVSAVFATATEPPKPPA